MCPEQNWNKLLLLSASKVTLITVYLIDVSSTIQNRNWLNFVLGAKTSKLSIFIFSTENDLPFSYLLTYWPTTTWDFHKNEKIYSTHGGWEWCLCQAPNLTKARIVWLWPTVSLQVSQQDDSVTLIWHNNTVVLRHRDSESDQVHVYKILKTRSCSCR